MESQIEARGLMMATNNILSPASEGPVATPSQECAGSCYHDQREDRRSGTGHDILRDRGSRIPYQCGKVDLHARIKVFGVTKIREEELKGEDKRRAKWKSYTPLAVY